MPICSICLSLSLEANPLIIEFDFDFLNLSNAFIISCLLIFLTISDLPNALFSKFFPWQFLQTEMIEEKEGTQSTTKVKEILNDNALKNQDNFSLKFISTLFVA